MSLDKIFGLYTILFLGITILIGIGETARAVQQPDDRLALHGPVAGHLRRDRRAHPHLQSRPVLRGRPQRPRLLQRHGHRLGLDVGGLVHLDGRRPLRAGLLGPGLRHGLDRRLPPARGVPRPLPAPVRRLHDPGLPGRALRRQHGAGHRRGRGHRVLADVSHRPGHRRRVHRGPLHRHRLQRRRLPRA